MALIKKQIFRPSKDENLQQFLAKDGADKARWPALTSRSMLETYRQDALDDSRRSVEQGQAEANKKAKAKKAVKSEPKSPWDDESDALAQKAFEVDPEGGAKQYDKKERDAKRQRLFERSVKYLKDNYPDQGSDNSNSADDTTGKQIKLAVQDAWFDKATSHGGWDETGSTHIPKGVGNELTSVKPGKKGSGDTANEKKEKKKKINIEDYTVGDSSKVNVNSGAAKGVDDSTKRRRERTRHLNRIEFPSPYASTKPRRSSEYSEMLSKPNKTKSKGAEYTRMTTQTGKGQTAEFRGGQWESNNPQPSKGVDKYGKVRKSLGWASKAVQDAVRDAWFEKGDVVPFESKDDKEKRDTKEHARRSAYNYIAANPKMFPDHHKNTDFSKPYDPKTDPKLQQGTKKKDTTPDPNKVSEAEKYFKDRI